MKKQKFALALFFLLPSIFCFSQNEERPFPQSWEGKWSGLIEIFKDTGKVQTLPMQLHILPIDSAAVPSWTWTIIYGEDQESGKRPYELVTLDATKGHYMIDEKNSIKMEGYFIGGQFYQWFEVQGNRLLIRADKVGASIVWEIVVGGTRPVSTTGDSTFDNEEIPPVLTYEIGTVQRALLSRR
ncbi:MAG: hypothetical protein AAFZ15_31295 [Bacteroidota bacterium]